MGMSISIILRIATVIAMLLPASVAQSQIAECIFAETCVDKTCSGIEPAVLRFNAMRLTDDGVSFFVIADPVLIDGPTIDSEQQPNLIGIVIDGGVGQLSLLPDEEEKFQISLSSFHPPILSQVLLIEETGPFEPSPATLTVQRNSSQGVLSTVHIGICDWVN
ncbi:hypothetical protein [Roseobacter litoralis]|nr:hypothetical protein [Roseobacter litoralis]GIT85852.1 hypothetical protein ROBYS_08680 [Roseobacter sp. OBYS 0001]